MQSTKHRPVKLHSLILCPLLPPLLPGSSSSGSGSELSISLMFCSCHTKGPLGPGLPRAKSYVITLKPETASASVSRCSTLVLGMVGMAGTTGGTAIISTYRSCSNRREEVQGQCAQPTLLRAVTWSQPGSDSFLLMSCRTICARLSAR